MEQETRVHDVAVIGAGMIGAASARHLAEAGHLVAVIGSPEPTKRASSVGPFASHYDEGRITRIIDGNPVWAELAARSISRYQDIAERSGISFHDPVGLAWIKAADQFESSLSTATQHGADARAVTAEWLREQTGIAVPSIDGLSYAYEGPPAGLVNPRRLVQAELELAEKAGATIIASAVAGIDRTGDIVTVSGPFGSVSARRILIAAGMYGAELAGVELAMTRKPRTTLRLELVGADVGANAGERVRRLPSLIAYQVQEPNIDRIYWTPPVEYPDGRVMLKIGGVYERSEPLSNDRDITTWFQGNGSDGEVAALRGAFDELLPDASVLSWEATPCVVTETNTGYPYIGWIDEQVAVAVGGNGGAAKSCDELGRLAASLFGDAEHQEPGGEPSKEPADLSLFDLSLFDLSLFDPQAIGSTIEGRNA